MGHSAWLTSFNFIFFLKAKKKKEDKFMVITSFHANGQSLILTNSGESF